MFDCAAVGFADVTSANVVGYSQIDFRKGSIMQGACFSTIATEGMKLSQLIPQGYEKNSSYTDSKKGNGSVDDITITILNANGGTAVDEVTGNQKKYYWRHSWDKKTKLWDVAGGAWWQYDSKTSTYVKITEDNDVVFGNGEGLYIGSQKYEAGMTILNNGEALFDAATAEIRKGSIGLSAPISAPCKLSKIKPVGYEKNSSYTDSKKGNGSVDDITITILNANGGTAVDEVTGNQKKYYWRHSWDKKTKLWDVAGGAWWLYDSKTTTYVKVTEDNDVEFKMGEGLYFGSQKYEGDIQIEFPGIDDLTDAE